MSSVALAYEDYVEGAAITDVSISGDMYGELEALQDMRLSKGVGFGAGTNGIFCYWNWGEKRPVDYVSLLSFVHPEEESGNLSLVLFGDDVTEYHIVFDAFQTPIYRYPHAGFAQHLHFFLDAPFQARRLLTSMSFSGPMSIGRVWAGPLWRPPVGTRTEWQPPVVDPGEMRRSRGNQGYPRRRQRHRRLVGEINRVPKPWAIGEPESSVMDIQQMGFRLGKTEPCVLFPYTQLGDDSLDVHSIHRLGCYGHFNQPLRPRHVGADRYKADVDFGELL
ncbi:MAG TPA: hypothetical protein PKZ76_13620 [Xanthomonadaceae bacterium]|nr:hypothetical protein [Xanthomonadaceae bacterium]